MIKQGHATTRRGRHRTTSQLTRRYLISCRPASFPLARF